MHDTERKPVRIELRVFRGSPGRRRSWSAAGVLTLISLFYLLAELGASTAIRLLAGLL